MTRTLTALFAVAFVATGLIAQPGRLPATKKLIEYGWDVPEPAFVAPNIREMEKRPFDGLIMRVAGAGRGNVFSGGKWDVADYQPDFAAMRAIKWGGFQHNFLMMYSASEQDWFSDADWANVLSNVNLMARIAKAGGCSLAFDAEPYGTTPWSYTEQKHAKEKTYSEYASKVRQRGGQFMDTIAKVLPDNVLLTFFTFSLFPSEMDVRDAARRSEALQQHPYSLYVPFLLGMLDKLGPGMTMTDGNEPSYYYDSSEKYYEAYHMMRQRALGLIPPELVCKFQTNTQASQALYMDYVFGRVPWPTAPGKFMPPEDQAKWFEHNVYWALKTTDEYVWLYSEQMNWWTSENIPAGMEQAIINAREAIVNNRGSSVDMRETMERVEERRQAEIEAKLVRRAVEVPILVGAPIPVIDGKLDDGAWQRATKLEPFLPYFGVDPQKLKAKTEAWVTYDGPALYLAVRAEEPTPEKVAVVGLRHDDPIWAGDAIEVFLSQGETGTPFYHFIVNPSGVQWDGQFKDGANDIGFDPPWQSAVQVDANQWTAEMAIPWKELGIGPRPGMRLRVNICRQRIPDGEQTCWSQMVSGFQEADHFGVWTLR